MKVRNMVKRLFAVGTGVAMLGATAMGALAADLGDYPDMFVKDGVFDGYFVVGENAASVDNIALTDISAGMKYRAADGTTTVSVEGEAHKLETSTDNFNIGEALTSIQSVSIDDGDLPTTLADGTYINDEGTEYAYEQTLDFASGTFELFSDSDFLDKEPTLGVRVPRNTQFMNYTIDFTKDPQSDATGASTSLTDFVDTKMNILGTEYDIVTATNATNLKLIMLSGAIKDTIMEGESKTYTVDGKEYEVMLSFTDSTPEAKFVVNGETTLKLAGGQTRKLADGTNFAVKEVLYQAYAGGIHSAEFYLGARKLTLEDNQKVELNDEDVDELTVFFSEDIASSKTSFSDLKFVWRPDVDTFVSEGTSLEFPAFGTYTLSYEGLYQPTQEVIEVENSGDREIQLQLPIKSGDATIRLLGSNTTVFDAIGGDDADEILLTTSGASPSVVWNSSIHEMLAVTYFDGTAAGETYLLEVSKIDGTDGVTLKDVVGGVKWEDKKNGTSFTVGSATLTVANIQSGLESVMINGSATTYFDRVITEGGMTVYLPTNAGLGLANTINVTGDDQNPGGFNSSYSNTGDYLKTSIVNVNTSSTYTVRMREEDVNGNLAAGDEINITVGHASSKVLVNGVTTRWASTGSDTYYELGDTEEYVGYVLSELGTKILYDTNPDQNMLDVVYSGEETYGNFYILGSGSATSSSAGGVLTSVNTVDATKLDSEVADVTMQNLIVVGGPCVNSVAAELMGNPANCADGFTPGKARVKLFANGDYMAMLVAGYSGADTRLAGSVIAHRADDLTGMEVEVEGTSYATATIGAPTVMEEVVEPVVEEPVVDETTTE